MITDSLDPRVRRLPEPPINNGGSDNPLGTYEVFVAPAKGKPYQHEGIVHASDPELAFVLAKEAFTRRFTCYKIFVVATSEVSCSPTTEATQSVFEFLDEPTTQGSTFGLYEIFFLYKRGKQHVHAGQVEATNFQDAFYKSKKLTDKLVLNIWAIATNAIRFTKPDEEDFWLTLPDKRYRDAADYKAGDKLKNFLDSQSQNHAGGS